MIAWRHTVGTIYFLQVAPTGPIKIGFTSRSVQERIRGARQSSPHDLTFLGSFPGTPVDERAAQKQLAGSQLRGEWFHPTDDVVAFIADKTRAASSLAPAAQIVAGMKSEAAE